MLSSLYRSFRYGIALGGYSAISLYNLYKKHIVWHDASKEIPQFKGWTDAEIEAYLVRFLAPVQKKMNFTSSREQVQELHQLKGRLLGQGAAAYLVGALIGELLVILALIWFFKQVAALM
jgi:hypothetical protein